MSRRHTRSDEMRAAQAERFAARLADLLYELGLTHKDVALVLHVPVGTVDSWTRGADPKIPSEINLGLLCALLEERKPGAGESLAQAAGRTWSPPAVPIGSIESPDVAAQQVLAATVPLEASPPGTIDLPSLETRTIRKRSLSRAFIVPLAFVFVLLALSAVAIFLQGQDASLRNAGTATPGSNLATPDSNYTPPPGLPVLETVRQGDRLLGERKALEALETYEMALANEPRNSLALLGKGRALADLERYEEAAGSLLSALSASPGDPAILLARARVYLKLGYWDYAEDDAARVLEADPSSLDALLAQARARAGASQWPAALGDYGSALKAHPADPAIYLDRGEAYLAQGNVAEARMDFEKALSLDPKNAPALVALGRAYLAGALIEPNKALEYFSKAVEADSRHSDAFYWRGYVYLEHRAVPASARDDFTQAIEIGPANLRLYHARAQSFELLGDPQAQLGDLDRAIIYDPHNPSAYHMRYQYYYWTRQYMNALKDLDTEIEGEANDPSLYRYRSELFLLLSLPVEAEAEARQAVELGSEYAPPHVALAQALSAQQKYTDALVEADRAVRANDPDNHVDALAARGWIHLKMAQATQASADFEEALKVEPLNRMAHFGRAILAIDNKQYQPALVDIEVGISQFERYGLGYVLRARVALAQDEPDKARADLLTAKQRVLYPDEVAQADALLAQLR